MKTYYLKEPRTFKQERGIAWLGLDAHAKCCLLAWLDEGGQRREHWRFPTTEHQLIKHLRQVPVQRKRLALEECGLSRWLAQVAAPHVEEVIVCDPRENFRISRHHHKCDEEDGYSLAHLNRLGALKAVWQPRDDRRAVFKCAAQAYLEAVHRLTALKLQLKARYRQWGVIPRGGSVFGRSQRANYLRQIKQSGVRAQLQLLYELLDLAAAVRDKARRLMASLGRGFPEIGRLRTVPGVGPIGAHLFVAFLQEPSRFESAPQLFRYCRLGIRDRSSDGKPLGYQRLDRCGHGVLKGISYRAWLVAKKRGSGPVYAFYQASIARSHNQTHARLNTQRKILLSLWRLWLKEAVFDAKAFLGDEAQPTTKVPCG